MNCAEAEQLLGAYALEALTPDEAQRMEEHLRSCSEHRADVAGLRQTCTLLSLIVEDREPSPDLRRRITAGVKAAAAPAGTIGETPAKQILPLRRPRRAPRWLRRSGRLAVAASVALALGIAGVIGYRVGLGSQAQVAYTFQGDPAAAPGAEARLVYFKDRKQAVIAASGLPRLSAGQVYEIWLIKSGVPLDKGISANASGDLAAQLSGDLSQFQQFAITIEPGEQQLPTTKPILVGNLQSGST